MKIVLIIVLHVAGAVSLVFLGLHLNTLLNTYAGVISVLSLAVGAYSTTVSILYNRNRRFHLLINRFLMRFRRTHTYWWPQVFAPLSTSSPRGSMLIDRVWDCLSQNTHGKVDLIQRTENLLAVDLDRLMGLRVRHTADDALSISFDRKLLVPSHMYDQFRLRLARLMEDITRIAQVESIQCSLKIDFDEGRQNPYYGFFVSSIPGGLLSDFQVAFQVSSDSRCRVEASKECINVEGCGLSELFETASQVLALRVFPKEG